MKKLVKMFGLLAVIACLCLSVAACDDLESADVYVKGTYEYSMSAEGASTLVTLELKSGGNMTMTVKVSMNGQHIMNESVNGTYKVIGTKLTLIIDGEKQEATIKDGKISMAKPMGGSGENNIVLTKK